MKLRSFFLILLLTIYCCSLNAQSTWKAKFGIWANVELYNRLKGGQPFDSTVNIIPRFLWLTNLKELEIENRFEQKRKYPIKKITNKVIIISNAQLLLQGDTIIMKDRYRNVTRFIKYK
jgi:hypothetical protein